jgi:aminopeptidase N
MLSTTRGRSWGSGFPRSAVSALGNGGYDVTHYDLALDYDPVSDRLDGQAVITATATQDLDQFDLDLRDFADILKLEVDGHSAGFAFEGEQELVITPRPKLKTGTIFQVEVQYAGVPPIIVDPDESIEGWVPTDDGAFVVNEPQDSPGWYPANDNPRDKATYDLAITVPEGRAALGNGVLVGQSTHDGKTTWRWRESRPMASYLVTATNGTFNLDFRTLDSGLPFYQAVDLRDAASMFDGTIYTRGAMTLQALRQKIGDAASSSCCRPGMPATSTATPRPRTSRRSPRR